MKKGIKTTVASFVCLSVVVGLVVAYVFGKIDVQGLTVSLGALGTSFTIIIGFLAKDQDKTHTNNE